MINSASGVVDDTQLKDRVIVPFMVQRVVMLQPTGRSLESVRLDGTETVLGRGDDADRSIEHGSLSRRHAVIRQGPAGWSVADLGSTNGTFVNWIRLEHGEEVPIREGDVVAFGTADYAVRLEGPEFEQQRAAPARRSSVPSKIDDEEYRTRGSLLMRLGADSTMVREVSWQQFYAQYVPIIRGFARNSGCPKSEIEDIVHEVMTSFFRAAERFEYDASKGRFRGYLKTATLNTIRNRYRKSSREPRVDFDPSFLEETSDHAEALWTREWRSRTLERAIEFVREETRVTDQSLDAFELYGCRGVPLEEAARQLGMSPAATQKAKLRVAEAIREELERIRLEEG